MRERNDDQSEEFWNVILAELEEWIEQRPVTKFLICLCGSLVLGFVLLFYSFYPSVPDVMKFFTLVVLAGVLIFVIENLRW